MVERLLMLLEYDLEWQVDSIFGDALQLSECSVPVPVVFMFNELRYGTTSGCD